MPTERPLCSACGQQQAILFVLPDAGHAPLCGSCTTRLQAERQERAQAAFQARHERQTARRKEAGAS